MMSHQYMSVIKIRLNKVQDVYILEYTNGWGWEGWGYEVEVVSVHVNPCIPTKNPEAD